MDYNVSKCKCSRIGVYASTKVAKNLSNTLFNNKLFNNTLLNVALSFLTNRTNSSSYLLLRDSSHRSWLVGSRLLGILGRGLFSYNTFFSQLKIYIYFLYNIEAPFRFIFIFRKTINWSFSFVLAIKFSNSFFIKLLIHFFCRCIIYITAIHTTFFNHKSKQENLTNPFIKPYRSQELYYFS